MLTLLLPFCVVAATPVVVERDVASGLFVFVVVVIATDFAFLVGAAGVSPAAWVEHGETRDQSSFMITTPIGVEVLEGR